MKKLLFLAALCIYLPSFAQEDIDNDMSQYIDIEKYKDTLQKSTFDEKFPEAEDKKNFRRLREYLKEREDICYAIRSELQKYMNVSYETDKYNRIIEDIEKAITGKNDKDSIPISCEALYDRGMFYQQQVYYDDPGCYTSVYTAQKLLRKFRKKQADLFKQVQSYNKLRANLRRVRDDIYKCRSQIDSALAPEYKQQDFRLKVSICFALVIAVLLFSFFAIIYKRSDGNLYKELLSGSGLQFITLFVLIISIVVFGILGILESKELSAILAGISGYILGKGLPERTSNAQASINVGGEPVVEAPKNNNTSPVNKNENPPVEP